MSLEPLAGLVVVDLYAGSGALGIEALSRGAIAAHFVERDRAALLALKTNLETLGLESRATVWTLGLPHGLPRLQVVLADADLVLADPPYGGAAARELLVWLGSGERLKDSARVGVEHHRKDGLPEDAGVLTRIRERVYGETVVSLYGTRVAATGPANEEGG
jgi:16S rRNA (guanine(966)-N(2))-methyltransferase RsmD